tara:strand:+ start:3305 stop:3538 length:234 start_codon:yes stop_codon:yes gene_type:complete
MGSSALKRLSIGDLVYWSNLEVDDSNGWYEKKTQGVLTDIVVEEVGGRSVYFGVVIPVKNQIQCKVFLFLLNKIDIS